MLEFPAISEGNRETLSPFLSRQGTWIPPSSFPILPTLRGGRSSSPMVSDEEEFGEEANEDEVINHPHPLPPCRHIQPMAQDLSMLVFRLKMTHELCVMQEEWTAEEALLMAARCGDIATLREVLSELGQGGHSCKDASVFFLPTQSPAPSLPHIISRHLSMFHSAPPPISPFPLYLSLTHKHTYTLGLTLPLPRSPQGNTALHMACANGEGECCAALLASGADPASRNNAGNTPLHWAAENGGTPLPRTSICLRCLGRVEHRAPSSVEHIFWCVPQASLAWKPGALSMGLVRVAGIFLRLVYVIFLRFVRQAASAA